MFKVGDKIKVQDKYRSAYSTGHYSATVTELIYNTTTYVYVRWDDGCNGSVRTDEIELVTPAKPKTMRKRCCYTPISKIEKDGIYGECLVCGNIFLEDGDILKNKTNAKIEKEEEYIEADDGSEEDFDFAVGEN